ncbi:hypothetical protein AB0425_17505 [Actinosynnema sp. NPDC051121]
MSTSSRQRAAVAAYKQQHPDVPHAAAVRTVRAVLAAAASAPAAQPAPEPADAEPFTWSGPAWYAFPPPPPKDAPLGVGLPDPDGGNKRYYFNVRARWKEWQVRQQARMASEVYRNGRALHVSDWYPFGYEGTYGSRVKALDLLYTVAIHDWPDLVPDQAKLDELVAAGDPAPVDAAFADLDRHARLLLTESPMLYRFRTGELVDRAKEVLTQQCTDWASTTDAEKRNRRDHARALLTYIKRALTPRYSYDGYPQVDGIAFPTAAISLDMMLCSSQGGWPPMTVVKYRGDYVEIKECRWSPSGGPPTHYVLNPLRKVVVSPEDIRLPARTQALWWPGAGYPDPDLITAPAS